MTGRLALDAVKKKNILETNGTRTPNPLSFSPYFVAVLTALYQLSADPVSVG
jgi:hypothetical protein